MCSSLQAELRNSAHHRSRGSSSDEERETNQRAPRRTAPVPDARGVHTRHRTSPRCWWCSHEAPHQSPMLVVFTRGTAPVPGSGVSTRRTAPVSGAGVSTRRTAPVLGAGGAHTTHCTSPRCWCVHTTHCTSPRCWWCSHDALHQSPVLEVFTRGTAPVPGSGVFTRRTAPVPGAGGVHTTHCTSPRCWWCRRRPSTSRRLVRRCSALTTTACFRRTSP